jgi:hypothetical protein
MFDEVCWHPQIKPFIYGKHYRRAGSALLNDGPSGPPPEEVASNH